MSKFSVSTEFSDLQVAVKATELLSCAFPMLTFEITEIPELDFSQLSLSESDWLNFVTTHEHPNSNKSFNDVLKEEFKNAQ